MQPRLTIQRSDATSWTIGKSMTLPDACLIAHVSIHSGRGDGARFMKKNSPPAPARHRHPEAHVVERAHGMGVGRDHEPDAARAGRAHPARLEVEAVRIAVDLDRRARLRDRVEHLLDAALERSALAEEPAEG